MGVAQRESCLVDCSLYSAMNIVSSFSIRHYQAYPCFIHQGCNAAAEQRRKKCIRARAEGGSGGAEMFSAHVQPHKPHHFFLPGLNGPLVTHESLVTRSAFMTYDIYKYTSILLYSQK